VIMRPEDAYWGCWQSHVGQARQHENLLARAGTIIVAASGALVAFIAEGDVKRGALLPAIVIIVLGMLGVALADLHPGKRRSTTRPPGVPEGGSSGSSG
jgi:hypothetical protein